MFLNVLPLLAVVLAPASAEPVTKVAYRISGVAVSTRDGAPIPYCRIQITESSTASAAPQDFRRGGPNGFAGGPGQRERRQEPTEVDADVRGHFQISVDHPGAYILAGSAREYRRQNFDAHEGFFSSVVLTPAAPVANLVFRMERDASITGLVLDEAGEPVRNAQVIAEAPGQAEGRGLRFGRGGGGQQAGFAQTDDRGRYELSSLAPGAYRVRVQAQPWYAQGLNGRFGGATAGPALDPSLDVVYPATWFPGVEDEAAAEPIQVSGGEERQADFHMTAVASVHLLVPRPEAPPPVDGQPRPQRNILLTRVSPQGGGGGFGQTTVSPTAQEFGGLSPGLYELRTVGPDGRPDPAAKQFRVLPGASGVVDLSTAAVLTKVKLVVEGVDPGEAGQLTFVEASTGRTVPANGGFGNFGGRRRGEDDDAEQERAVYLSQGRWEVHTPAFGTSYLIELQAKGATARGSLLDIGSEAVTLTLKMGSGRGEISGFAALNDKPAQGAMVLLVPATLGEPGSVAEVQRDQTNTDGSFHLRGVVPGRYILLSIDHGWGVKWRDAATLAGYLARGTPVEVEPKSRILRNLTALAP